MRPADRPDSIVYLTRDHTGEPLPDPGRCGYCDRTSDVCQRIPGHCCGGCTHHPANEPREEGVVTEPETDPRGTCRACAGSADGCQARQAARCGRCCRRCDHPEEDHDRE